MASCLGLYVEKNLIKYAKVSKSNDAIKVESFGVKFYENLENAVKQVVEETYSFKIPISINLTDETYNQFEVFNMLSPKDMKGVITTEFENICYDKDDNPNIYEQKYIIANTNIKNEKLRVIHVSAPKTAIAQKKNQFADLKVSSIVPIGLIIPNLLKQEKKATTLVVNIEKNTTITKVYNNAVSDIAILPIGAQDIIENINQKENSYSKSYEICKNATIYTEKDKDLQYEENEYLVDIMPILFQIVSEVRKIMEESFEKIDKVYITGTASVINNIDIYFQDYLGNVPCEVLKPSFIGNNSKINVKDYIEVNSAISLAIQGLEKSNPINFTKESMKERTFSFLKRDISNKNVNITAQSIDAFLDKFSRQYNVAFSTFAFITIIYFVGILIINGQLDNKILATNNSIQNTNNRIQQVEEYNIRFNQQITNYQRLIAKIEDLNDANSEDKRYRNTIPNLLNNIMAIIPKQVQLTSIDNSSSTHIIINARSARPEQVAIFKTKLKTEGILKNVVSDTGTMQSGYLSVTIEGELP